MKQTLEVFSPAETYFPLGAEIARQILNGG